MSERWSGPYNDADEIDEGYWQSLLADGEIVSSSPILDELPPEPWHKDRGGQDCPDNVSLIDVHAKDWDAAEQAHACMEVLTLPITGYNRGGLLVQFHHLCGFVPASHLVNLPRLPDPEERAQALAERVGQTLNVCIIEVDRTQGRLILSQRAAHEGRRGQEILQCLKPGDVCRGRVTNLRPFGAFVDLGGIEGLLHISELSWGRVAHPGEVVRPGDEIDVYVMSIDRAQRKIALSLKRLTPDPWHNVVDRYQVDQIVSGLVTNVVSFGAFVRLEEGVEGLIHISELAEGQFLHPRNVVQEGDEVRVRILNIDPVNRRMGLSLRRVNAASPADEIEPASAAIDLPASDREPIAVW